MRAGARGLLAAGIAAAALIAPAAPAATADPAPSAAASDAAPGEQTMTWTQIHDRMMTWVGNKKITYSQSGTYPGPGGTEKYRRDCSGFVSMALHLPSSGGGPNTVTMTKYVHRIAFADLQPGDLLGHLGSGSAGDNGHVRIFVSWADKAHTKINAAEQGWVSNPNYPHISVRPAHESLDSGDPLLPYRYNHKK